jgi:hypothetical protein
MKIIVVLDVTAYGVIDTRIYRRFGGKFMP